MQTSYLKILTSEVRRFPHLNMKTLFATALLIAVAASEVYSQACHMREVDMCSAIGMFHYQSNGIPRDEEKLHEFCEIMKEVQDCMGNFTATCISPMQREVMGLFSGSDEEGRQLCTEGSETRALYLNHAECLSEGAESDEFKGYMKDLQIMIEKLFEVPYKQRFPLLCCGFRRFHQSTDSMTERRCGQEAVDMTRNIMTMVTSDLPETICQSYDSESEECQAILPPPGTEPTGGENRSQLGKLLDVLVNN